MKKFLITLLTVVALFVGSFSPGIYAQGVLGGVFRGAARGAGTRVAGRVVIRTESRVMAAESLASASVRSGGRWASRAEGRIASSSITWGDPVAAHGQGSFARAQIGPVALTTRSTEGYTIRAVIRPGSRVVKESIANVSSFARPWLPKASARSLENSSARLVERSATRYQVKLARANIGSAGATIAGRAKGTINIAKPVTMKVEQTSWWKPRFVGRGSTAEPARMSFTPRNLKEKLAIEQAKSNPAAGMRLKNISMNDARWPAQKGWVKMRQVVKTREKSIKIHYVRNILTGEYDDFKIKQ